MGDITKLLQAEIYPKIFERADMAFPELQFRRAGQDWHSPLKLDGQPAKTARRDKTKITAALPSRLFEQGGENISFWDYIAGRDNLADNQDILKRLADLAGYTLPALNPEALKAIEKQRRAADIWAAIVSYCQEGIKTTEAAKVREYLAGRGYKPEHIEAMGLGFLPSQAKLFEHLKTKGFKAEELGGINLHKGIGTTNPLIIPYKASGRIIGIAARRIEGSEENKYLYNTGLTRRPELFNLNGIRGDKDLVVVEGLLDALAASVIAGIPSVVALGDNSGFNKERIDEVKRLGARKITLCLDNDEPGKEGTKRAIQELKIHAPELPVYVAILPEDVKDPDELIRKPGGADTLKEAIKGIHGWKYTLQNIINERAGEELTDKSMADMVEELERAAAEIKSPAERDEAYALAIVSLAPYGITKESFQKATEAIRQRERLEKQERDLTGLINEAARLNGEGKAAEVLDLLQTRSRELKARGADYSALLMPIKEADIIANIKGQPDSLESGYNIGKDKLLLPAGALSFIVGPTSHGKTTLLLNVLLNAAAIYPGKKFHLFSYEESREAVIVKALNTYANMVLSNGNNRGTIKSHYRGEDKYFTGGSAPAEFLKKKASFYRELIDTGRVNIHYADYTAPELVEAIRYLKDHGDAGAVFIDYMQLLKKPGTGNSRQEELKEICQDLKDIAVDTGLPLVLAAQFNRNVDSPLDLHATNIGEAGDIERVASLVLGLWDGNHKIKADPKELKLLKVEKYGLDEEGLNKGKLYLEVLKNRDGETGQYGFLDFDGNLGKIASPKSGMDATYGR